MTGPASDFALPGWLLTPWPVGTALNRWNLGEIAEAVFPGRARPMPDHVDYVFRNGWTETGDLPCREAWRAYIAGREVARPEGPFGQIYIGGETGDVDFSAFRHLPTVRTGAAMARLTSPRAQTIRLRVSTYGGVHLWADTALVAAFEPYIRNQPCTTEISVPLEAGETDLWVRFEDLHERDTRFGFRLELLEGAGIRAGIRAASSAERLAEAVALLESLRTTQVFFEGTEVALTADTLPETPLPVALWGQEAPLSQAAPIARFRGPRPGCHVLPVRLRLGDVTLIRHFGTTLHDAGQRIDQATPAARKESVLARLDARGDITTALTALAQGRFDPPAEAALDDALANLEERRDCADFRMMALLWIWRDYRSLLPQATADRLESALLGFRYWLDTPGNDVMWFWSENHVLCFHVAEFLAGGQFSEKVFPASGLTGAAHRDRAAKRLHRWFDAIAEHGLVEWNSAAYYPINIRALVGLLELSDDPFLADRARDLLDRIAVMVALHASGGVPAGSQGRIYEKEVLAGAMTELAPVAAVLFGGRHVPGLDGAAAMLCLSRYEAPPGAERLAWPKPGQTVAARYCQGVDRAGLHLWKTAHVQLSTAQLAGAGKPGHQQHMLDLQFAAHPLARVWVNHPGDEKVWSEARPSFLGGNGRLPRVNQSGRAALMLYRLTPEDIPYTHAFVPAETLDEVVAEGPWLFFRSGAGYGALWASGGLTPAETGQYRGTEWRQTGAEQGWAVIAGGAEDGDFECFAAACRACAPRHRPGQIALTLEGGDLTLDWEGGLDEGLSVEPEISLDGGPWVAFGEG